MSSIRSLLAALVLAPAAIFAQDPAAAAARPSITVGAFEYGTVAAQIASDRATRRRLEKMGIRDGANFAEALGIGAADLIIEELMKTGAFRVLERRQLDAIRQEQSIQPDSITSASPTRVARARYIVSGSVTRLGFEEKHLGGLAGRVASSVFLYGLGGKKNSTFVNLTARVIDSETGEIIASFTGEGKSSRGWGVTVFGMGGWGLGGAKMGSDNVRESAIGEATAEAAAGIAERIGQLRATLAAGA
ncbi:MAG: CsgG/HfaB family protein [Gemmatimonadaceae bacterium]|nr:CsgG/HfaB family protein [Gemmatimonadaceae bacterium]